MDLAAGQAILKGVLPVLREYFDRCQVRVPVDHKVFQDFIVEACCKVWVVMARDLRTLNTSSGTAKL